MSTKTDIAPWDLLEATSVGVGWHSGSHPLYRTPVIRSRSLQLQHRTPTFRGHSAYCPCCLQQAMPETWCPSPQMPTTSLWGRGWVAATTLKAHIDQAQPQIPIQAFLRNCQCSKEVKSSKTVTFDNFCLDSFFCWFVCINFWTLFYLFFYTAGSY